MDLRSTQGRDERSLPEPARYSTLLLQIGQRTHDKEGEPKTGGLTTPHLAQVGRGQDCLGAGLRISERS